LVEVPVIVSQKFSFVQTIIVATNSQSELVVSTTKEPEPIKGGAKLAIVSCTLSLPIECAEVLIVVVNIRVEGLEKPATPKLVPLIIPKIGVGVKVTLIDSITHTSEVFRTLDTILKDTPIVKRLESEYVPLAEPINTTSEILVDDLAARVKHVVLGD